MELTTIIQSALVICAILGLNFALMNMLNNNLKDVFRTELKRNIDPINVELESINEKLDNHVTDTDKKPMKSTRKLICC